MGLQASRRQEAAVVASVVLHVALTLGPSWAARGALAPEGESRAAAAPAFGESIPIGLDLPSVEGSSVEDPLLSNPTGAAPPPPSGRAVSHPDSTAAGRGGEETVRDTAVNMSDTAEPRTFSPDLLSRLDRDQVERLRAGRSRRSWEDRRSTPNPAELTLVAIGRASVPERRPRSDTVPSRGVIESTPANLKGGGLGDAAEPDMHPSEPREGSNRLGSEADSPGMGLRQATTGLDHRPSAPVASARPSIARGPIAVQALERGRAQDDVDAEQEVARTLRAIVHASSTGGVPGSGEGGTAGSGDPAAGGPSGEGFVASPLGLADGAFYDYFTSDPRLLPYFRRIHEKIDPLWKDAFPKSALLNLEQGTVILVFTVFSDGRVEVEWPPLRPSGIDEFDRNCASAIRRAAPLPPIPPALGPSLRIRAPFVESNPVVK